MPIELREYDLIEITRRAYLTAVQLEKKLDDLPIREDGRKPIRLLSDTKECLRLVTEDVPRLLEILRAKGIVSA